MSGQGSNRSNNGATDGSGLSERGTTPPGREPTDTELRIIIARFDPHRLRVARHLARTSKAAFAAQHDFNPSLIAQYETGRTRPSPASLTRLAHGLDVRPGFFALERPLPTIGPPHFRTERSTTKPQRDQAIAETIIVWDIIQELEQHVRFPVPTLPEYPVPPDAPRHDIETVAQQTRAALAVPDGPVANMVRLLETHGTIITRLRPDSPLEAFSINLGGRPFIRLGHRTDGGPARTDAAHELGHLVMHPHRDGRHDHIERQAEWFATAFLAPADQIIEQLPHRFDLARLIELKHRWGTTVTALLERSHALRTITESAYRRAITTMTAAHYNTTEPAPIRPIEQPALIERALAALQATGILIDAISDSLHLEANRLKAVLNLDDQRPTLNLDP